MYSIARVLVAGRDEPNLNALHQLLESAGHAVSRTACAEDAARRVSAGEADVVLLADDALASLARLIESQRSNPPMSFVALSSTLSSSGARDEQPRAEPRALAGVDLRSPLATLEQLERAYIMHVLALESGHQSRTALRLGIDRRTLYRKLKQYRSE